MREDVCIALNEREPLKHQMAQELEDQLSLRSISCSRIELTSNLAKLIKERRPRILVLDFILGDVATALDVLTELQSVISRESSKQSLEQPIKILMWTDEQSVQVVVTAMKLGASDFIRLDEPKSLQKILASIDKGLEQAEKKDKELHLSCNKAHYQEPIGSCQIFKQCIQQCNLVARQNKNTIILQADMGCGRNTLAHYIHKKRTKPGDFVAIDFDTFQHDASHIVGEKYDSSNSYYLSHAATVFIDHAEFDTGELLNLTIERQKQIWEINKDHLKPTLIIGTSCEETAKSWQRLLNANLINVPNLKERKTDFLELFQHFQDIAHSYIKKISKNQPISPAYITLISELDWPGNIRQFKACIIEAVVSANEFIDTPQIKEDVNSKAMQQLTQYEQNLFNILMSAKDRWLCHHSILPHTPAPLVARKVLDNSNGDYRIAAARLGTGISQIKLALSNNLNTPQENSTTNNNIIKEHSV